MSAPDKQTAFANAKVALKGQRRALRIASLVLVVLAASLLVFVLGLGLMNLPFTNEAFSLSPIANGDVFPGQDGQAQNGHLPNMTADEIALQEQRGANPEQPESKINTTPVFKSGRAEGDLLIENPSYNLYPMVVQIILDETDEIIYDSGGLMPNQHIAEAKLIRALRKGTYGAKAYINYFDPDTNVWVGQLAKDMELTVKE
jgi:hypothetical protein